MKAMCFYKLFLFKALLRPHPLKSTLLWSLPCFQHRGGKVQSLRLGFRYLSIRLSTNTNISSVEKLAQMLHITQAMHYLTVHSPLVFWFFSMRPPDHCRLCEGATLWIFSLEAQAEEKPRAYSGRLKTTRLRAVSILYLKSMPQQSVWEWTGRGRYRDEPYITSITLHSDKCKKQDSSLQH